MATPPKTKVRYFVPIFGSYYHFLNESALGLYNMLKGESLLDSLDCKLWYQGSYGEVVQMFSRHPITRLPVVKPYLKDASSIGPDIKTLRHVRLCTKQQFAMLFPMVDFLTQQIPEKPMEPGITIVKRVKKRVYSEGDELGERLCDLGLPIRVVRLEAETFARQVNIMRNTVILIAPHGAGTMNQIFMPPGGTILELFPKGYSNWHARAVADLFGHQLIEIESTEPGVFGRKPDERTRQWIDEHGWPDRDAAIAQRKISEDFMRVIRDVASYSIPPDRVAKVLKTALRRRQGARSTGSPP